MRAIPRPLLPRRRARHAHALPTHCCDGSDGVEAVQQHVLLNGRRGAGKDLPPDARHEALASAAEPPTRCDGSQRGVRVAQAQRGCTVPHARPLRRCKHRCDKGEGRVAARVLLLLRLRAACARRCAALSTRRAAADRKSCSA